MTEPTRTLPTTNPVVFGILGALMFAVIAGWILVDDRGVVSVRVALICLLLALAIVLNMVRPRMRVQDHDLVMVNPLTTTRIPLRLVERYVIRAVTVVLVGKRRYTSPSLGRRLGNMRREQRGRRVEIDPVVDLAEQLLHDLIATAKREDPRGDLQVSRHWDVLAVGPMAALLLGVLATFLV